MSSFLRSFPVICVIILALSPAFLKAAPGRSVIFILADGLRLDTFNRLLAQGSLPNIKRRMVDRGFSVRTTTTVYPSTTGPAYAPFVCGLMPRKAGLPGIRWYDRKRMISRVYCGTDFTSINGDLNPDFPTIYELVGPNESCSVMGILDRGSANRINPIIDIAPAKFKGDFIAMDDTLFNEFISHLNKLRDLPRFSFISLHSPDSVGHSTGPLTRNYDEAVIEIDHKVGRLFSALVRSGLLEKTYVIISADHGMSPTNKHENIGRNLAAKLRLKVRDAFKKTALLFNSKSISGKLAFDIHIEVSGNNCVQLYLANPEGRTGLPLSQSQLETFVADRTSGKRDASLERTLLRLDCIDSLYIRGDKGVVRVVSADGETRIAGTGRMLSYELVSGTDPLGYADDPRASSLMDGRVHHVDDWFAATENTRFPDAIFHIHDLMQSERSGDIIVLARPGWEPWDEGQHGVHGGSCRNEMLVPLVIAGPGIRKTVHPRARTVDVFPTICAMLGIRPPKGIDGKVLPCFTGTSGPVAAYLALLAKYEKAGREAFMDPENAGLAANLESIADKLEARRRSLAEAVVSSTGAVTLDSLLALGETDIMGWYAAAEVLELVDRSSLSPDASRRVDTVLFGLSRDVGQLAELLKNTYNAIGDFQFRLTGLGVGSTAPQIEYLKLLQRADALEQFFIRRVTHELLSGSNRTLRLLSETVGDADFRHRLKQHLLGLRKRLDDELIESIRSLL